MMYVCVSLYFGLFFFFFKQKTAYEMRISDWSSDVCSSDLGDADHHQRRPQRGEGAGVAGWQLGVEAREREDDRDLHQLRWLEVDDAEVEPALAAAPDETEQFDADEIGRASCRERGCQYV